MADDFKRITIRSLKDTASGAYSISEYDKDIRAIERALKSALPQDAFYHTRPKEINYNDPTFHQIGKLREDFYVKESYARVAQESIDQVVSKMLFKGTQVDPKTGLTHEVQTDPKYWATRVRPLSNDENNLIKELEKAKEKKDAEKETETSRFNRGTFLKILGAIMGLADIARRILSSVLNIATQQVKETTEAHNLGISREQMRQYGRLETAHGLKEGTISGALSDIQSKFGNITTLDESSLEALAVVMGGKIEEMAKMGLGSSNPEAILGAILDEFNAKANSGVNSIGQYVGETQARRELYSYLMKISPQVADIFATMQEEQHNINSLFRNQAGTFAEWKNTIKPQRNTTQAGEGVLFTLGEEWNVFKALLDEIKHALAVSIAPTLTRILRRINNMRIGMSTTEKLQLNAENRDANEKAIKETEASIAFMEKKSGGVKNMSISEKAYYDTLVQYKKDLEKENKETNIGYIVRTPNELKVEQESRIRSHYKQIAERAYFAETIDEAVGELKGETFSNDEIMRVINAQGTGSYGKKALADFQKDYIAYRTKELKKEMPYASADVIRRKAESESIGAFARANYKFFYPTLLGLKADRLIQESYNDQVYDIDRAREKWGANFEGLASALPEEALGTHKLYSVDVNENGVIIHKLVLDINDSDGVDKGDFEIASWTGNDRGGATGTQTKMVYDKETGVTVQAYADGASRGK